jgi:tetratricopeptide (TPR) repeat protein
MCIALIIVTLAVYLQVGTHEFVNLDDDVYVTDNHHVTSGITGKNIIWALTSIDGSNWHPVTWLSHMTDVQLYGLKPGGHHLTNVAIHILATLTLFLLLIRMSGALWQSLFVAALFALHPLHVESVAWVAERKDVLSAFFGFCTLLLYAEYVAKPKPALYLLTIFCFVLGLMSKPMLVTLPALMLLIDFWPLDRFRREDTRQQPDLLKKAAGLIKEKIPFFFCSLLSCLITIHAQHEGGAVASLRALSLGFRIGNSLIAYLDYIVKIFWPQNLAVYYPFPLVISTWQAIASLLILLLVSAASIRAAHKLPYFVVGWFWFLITLVPVIGLIQVGGQSMADRYSYIPAVGLFISATWGTAELTKTLPYRRHILGLLSAIIISISAALTWQQLGYWQDSISLYRHTLPIAASTTIKYNLGAAFQAKGNFDAAIKEYEDVLRVAPDYKNASKNLGVAILAKGDPDAAILKLQLALRIDPNDSDVHYNLGLAFQVKGDPDSAISQYQAAIRLNPDNADAHHNLGLILAGKRDFKAAAAEFREVLRINPDDPDADKELKSALVQITR